jgi:hypothetical protein
MSRGPGTVMTRLEALLTDEPQTVWWLAIDVYGGADPSRAQVESVRRAAKRLAAIGRAEVGMGNYREPGPHGHDVWRRFLTVRKAATL